MHVTTKERDKAAAWLAAHTGLRVSKPTPRSKNVLGLREEEEIVIDRRDFEARAAAVGVHSYEDFYACKMFTSRFVHDAETAAIRRVPDDLASPAGAAGRSTAATP